MPCNDENHSVELPLTSADKLGVLRIIDAEVNRAAEGLRVVEDYVRFVLDDQHLTGLAKRLRHDLTTVLGGLASTDRLASREAQIDVGMALEVPQESHRSNISNVVAASFKRVQQALRCLEEYVKLLNPVAGAEIESLRFRSYTLERAVSLTADSLRRLSKTQLYVLIDGCTDERAFASLVELLVAAGVHALQLRDKRLCDRDLLMRARLLRSITKSTETLFIMNDRADLAVLAGADGVHLGQEELGVKDARAIMGPRAFVGISTHNIEQARRAVLDGANYIGAGPTFPSATKSFEAFAGENLLRSVAAEISLPAFAIGGINLQNFPQIEATGIRRVAVSIAVVKANDPAAEVRRFLERLTSNESQIFR
ncbi:MAG TPA: thiamine phosphate synthase [Pirellulales bacterium]|jgi:thiamine-phosphate pyrophosphorylase|nr:thiamine phosphate synthase [Pirellulales bacterium]